MRRRRLIVMGFMASCPIAGVIWQHLHYIIGLQRLGHEVYYVEDKSSYLYNPVTFDWTEDQSYAVALLRELAAEFGFTDRWALCLRYENGPKSFGLDLVRLRELYREADMILNVCGNQELNEDLIHCDRLVYIESDPGREQIRIDQAHDGTRDYLSHHCARFTFGENIGSDLFSVPLHGLKWLPTRQPIVTDLWKSCKPPERASFTTIANWSTRGQKDMAWRGKTYLWSKSEHVVASSEITDDCLAKAPNGICSSVCFS